MPCAALDDEEGPRLPASLPPVVDAHVHLFPDRVFEAIWRWFEQYGWPIRYKLHTPEVLSLPPLARRERRSWRCTTRTSRAWRAALNAVHGRGLPARAARHRARHGAPRRAGRGARSSRRPSPRGCAGVKLHCHVQCFAPDDAAAARGLRGLRRGAAGRS